MTIVEQRATPAPRPRLFTGRQWRRLREALTAYIFLLPAFLIIGTFGLLPVGFAVYVSLHRWRIIPGKYRGLANYVKAIDNLAYVVAFWLVIIFSICFAQKPQVPSQCSWPITTKPASSPSMPIFVLKQ